MKVAFAFIAMLYALGSTAYAQDGKTQAIAGAVVASLLDNDRVRVFEVSLKPGVKVPSPAHPAHLMYMLTEGTLVFSEDGKRPYEMIFKAGEAVWVPAQARAQNESEKEVRALIVEVKQPAAKPATKAKVKRKAKTRPAPAASAPASAKQ